jgi:hypothetical protein
MSAAEIEAIFPDLKISGYRITSPATSGYNCFAWAGNDTGRWWQPVRLRGYYWPTDVSLDLTLQNLVAVYERLGYVVCKNSEVEQGFDKVAIYVDSDGTPTHAARQLPSGAWTSKIGELEDVEHSNLASLERVYGKVAQFLRRPRSELPL